MAIPTAVTIPSRFAEAGTAFTFAVAPMSPTAIDWMPGDILLAFNSDSAAQTVTLLSSPKNRRTRTQITDESIAAGEYRVFPRFPPQDEDTILIQASAATVKFARLSTKAQPV